MGPARQGLLVEDVAGARRDRPALGSGTFHAAVDAPEPRGKASAGAPAD